MRRFKTPKRLEKLMKKDDWEMAVRVNEDDESVWILYRERDDTVKDLFVVVLDDQELVLVQAEGQLDRLMEKALADHHIDIPNELGLRGN